MIPEKAIEFYGATVALKTVKYGNEVIQGGSFIQLKGSFSANKTLSLIENFVSNPEIFYITSLMILCDFTDFSLFIKRMPSLLEKDKSVETHEGNHLHIWTTKGVSFILLEGPRMKRSELDRFSLLPESLREKIANFYGFKIL